MADKKRRVAVPDALLAPIRGPIRDSGWGERLLDPEATQAAQPAAEDGDAWRNFKRAYAEIPMLVGGAGAFIGDLVGAQGMRDKGLALYEASRPRVEELTRPSDSLSAVLDGEGNIVDFLQGATGYVAGQATQTLLTGGLGAILGRAAAKAVARRAGEAALEQAAKRGATAGAVTGVAGQNLVMEGGSIYPEGVEQARLEGRELTGADRGRMLAATVAAAGLDTAADVVMGGRILRGTAGASLPARAAREVPLGMVRESATETGQSVLERYGAGKPVTGDEARREYIDAAAIGAVGGGLGGGAASLRSRAGEDAGTLPPVAETPPPSVLPDQGMPDPGAGPLSRAVNELRPQNAPALEPTPSDEAVVPADTGAAIPLPPGVDADGVITTMTPRAAADPLAGVDDATTDPQTPVGLSVGGGLADGAVDEAPRTVGGRDDPAVGGEERQPVDAVRGTGADLESAREGLRQSAGPRSADPGRDDALSSAQAAAQHSSPPASEFDRRRAWPTLGEVTTFLARQRRLSGVSVRAKPVRKADGSFTFAMSGEPEFESMADEREVQAAAQTVKTEHDVRAHEAATSPLNDRPQPTEAQREAGNFKVGRMRVAGLDISVEYPAGSKRTGKSSAGAEWSRRMISHYGRIRRTEGADGEQVDVFVRPGVSEDYGGPVFVVDQVDPKSKRFDEHKILLGFASADDARRGYRLHYPKGWRGLGDVTEMSVERFREWLKSGDLTKPVSPVVRTAETKGAAPETKGAAPETKAPEPKQPAPAPERKEAPPQTGEDAATAPEQLAALTGAEPAKSSKAKPKRQSKAARGVAFSLAQRPVHASSQERFEQVAAAAVAGRLDRHQEIIFSDTPQVLARLGVERKPVAVSASVLMKMREEHGVPVVDLKRLPALLADPAMVFESSTVPGRFVVVTDVVMSRRRPLVIVIEPNGEVARTPAVVLTSAYPREQPIRVLPLWIRQGLLRYAHKGRSLQLATTAGLRLPGVVQRAEGFRPARYLRESDIANLSAVWPQAHAAQRLGSESGAGGMSVERVQGIVDELRARWANAPTIHVVPSSAELPEAARGPYGTRVEAAFFENEVYVVADALPTKADVVRAALHETLGHYGLRGTFGEALAPILDQIAIARRAEVAAKAKEYGLGDTLAERRIAAEEVLAEMAQTSPGLGFVQRAIAAIRMWLRRMGAPLRVSDDEIIARFILPARRFVERGGKPGAVRSTPAARSLTGDDAVFVSEVLAELAQHDDLFRYPVSRKATLDGVMAEVFPRASYLGEDSRVDEREESGADIRHMFRTPEGKTLYVFERGNEVWMDVSRLDEGERGAGFYAAALNYAHNAGKRFIGDPAGLSEAAVVRRTSAMLSSALRFGTTRHMEAAAEQLAGIPEKGIAPLKWLGDDLAKVTALIDSFLSTLYTQLPELKNYRYDFRSGRFIDQRGRPVAGGDALPADGQRKGSSVHGEARDAGGTRHDRGSVGGERGGGLPRSAFAGVAQSQSGRSSRAGEATLRRGIFLQSLVASEGGKRPELLENVLARGRALASGPLQAAFSLRSLNPTDPEGRPQAGTALGNIVMQFVADSRRNGRRFAWWRGINTQYHKATLDEHFRAVFESAQAFARDTSKLANEAADLAPRLLPNLQGFGDVVRKSAIKQADLDAIAKPIFEGTLSDVDPGKGKVWTGAELRERFGLNDYQVGLYQEFRRAVDRSLDDMGKSEILRDVGQRLPAAMRTAIMEAADVQAAARIAIEHLDWLRDLEHMTEQQRREYADDIDTIREKAERITELKRGGYAPLMRFGRYAVWIHKPAKDADGKPTRETLFFATHDNLREANRQARAVLASLREEHPDAELRQGIMSEQDYKLFAGITPDTLEVFGEAAQFTDSPVWREYIRLVKSSRSALKRMLERKGTPGYSTDVTRVLASFLTSNARAASGNVHSGEMLRAATAIPQNKGDVRDHAESLISYLRNPAEEASRLRGLMFTWFLGGSIASAAVNMTQPLTMTLPWLSIHDGAAKATARLAAAAKDAVRTPRDPRLREALELAEKEGIVAPQEIHQLQAEASRSLGNDLRVRKAMFVWGSLFALAEQVNRRVTFIAAYRQALDRNEKDPFKYAERAVIETQGIYNRQNRPDWARGAVGATIFTFKQYSIAYIEFLARLLKHRETRPAGLLALAILVVLSGASGLPGIEDLEDIVDTLAQAAGYNFQTRRARREFAVGLLGEHLGEFLERGVSSVPWMPIDVQQRMGLQNLFPGTGAFAKSSPSTTGEALEVLGVAGGFVEKLGAGVQNVLAGDLAQAGRSVAPVAIANFEKMRDMLATGMYRDTRGRKVIDVDAIDAFWKGMGFQPAGVARVQLRQGELQAGISVQRKTENEIAGLWADGLFEGDKAKVERARARLRDWNEKNDASQIRITAAQLRRRVEQMRMTRGERLLKATPREMRAATAAALATRE